MRSLYLLALLVALAGACLGLGRAPLSLEREMRHAETAREQAQRGPFTAPRLAGREAGAAPLLLWASAPAFRAAEPGRPDAGTLRLVPALLLLGAALTTFLLGRGWFSARHGALAALLCLSAPWALAAGRSFTPAAGEMCAATIVVGSALTAIRAVRGRRFLGFLACVLLGSALGVLAGGAFAPTLSLAALTVSIFAERGVRGLFTLRAISVLLVLLLGTAIGALLWLPALRRGEDPELLRRFVLGSLKSAFWTDAGDFARRLTLPWTLLLALGPALVLAPFAGPGRVHRLAPGGHPELPLAILAAWAAVPLALTLVGGAAEPLILAALPPIALLASTALLEPPREGKPATAIRLLWALFRAALALGVIGGLLLLPLLGAMKSGAEIEAPAVVIGLLALAALALDRLLEEERRAPLRGPLASAAAAALLLLAGRLHDERLREDSQGTPARFVAGVLEAVGEAPEKRLVLHEADDGVAAAFSYSLGAPLAREDDPARVRALLTSEPGAPAPSAEPRLLAPLAVWEALGAPGRKEAEVRSPVGRMVLARPAPAAPLPATGTAAPR
jgi:hypothetical protein